MVLYDPLTASKKQKEFFGLITIHNKGNYHGATTFGAFEVNWRIEIVTVSCWRNERN